MRTINALILASTFVTIVGCSGASTSPSGSPGQACTNDATATAVALANESISDRHEKLIADDEAHCRVRRGLILAADLPGQWTTRRTGFKDYDDGGDEVDCRTTVPRAIAGLRTELGLDGDNFGGAVLAAIYAFPPGGASDFMSALQYNCAEFIKQGPDAAALYGALQGITNHADETLAYHSLGVTKEEGGGTASGEVYVRLGDLVEFVDLIEVTGKLDLERASEIAAAKLQRIGALPEPAAVEGEGCPPTSTPNADNIVPQQALFALTDLPAGWVHDPPVPCGIIDDEGTCRRDSDDQPQPEVSLDTGFRRQGGYLRESVRRYAQVDSVAFMNDLARAAAKTSSCTAGSGAQSMEFSFEPLGGIVGGEQITSWTFTHSDAVPPDHRVACVAAIRRGQFVARISRSGCFDNSDPLSRDRGVREFQMLVGIADTKLQTLSAGQ